MKKVLVLLTLVLGTLVSNAQSYTITKRTETSTAKMGVFSAGFSQKKCDGNIVINDSLVNIKNDYENIQLTIISKQITTAAGYSNVGSIAAKDSANNKYHITIMEHMIHIIANIWNDEKGEIDAKTLMYYVK